MAVYKRSKKIRDMDPASKDDTEADNSTSSYFKAVYKRDKTIWDMYPAPKDNIEADNPTSFHFIAVYKKRYGTWTHHQKITRKLTTLRAPSSRLCTKRYGTCT